MVCAPLLLRLHRGPARRARGVPRGPAARAVAQALREDARAARVDGQAVTVARTGTADHMAAMVVIRGTELLAAAALPRRSSRLARLRFPRRLW